MKIVIEKKNFSPELTKMSYIKETNSFVGTDSFVLFEFIPEVVIGTDDFSITYSQLLALQKLTTQKGAITVRGVHELPNKKKVIEFLGDDGIFYLPILQHNFPNYRQPSILGQGEGNLSQLLTNKELEKFVKVGKILDEYGSLGKITDTTAIIDHNDEYGTYKVIYRKPIPTDKK